MRSLIVRLPDDLHDALKQNRQVTRTSAAEFIRRAIRLALFADIEAAERIALWKSLSPEQREKHFSHCSDLVCADKTSVQ